MDFKRKIKEIKEIDSLAEEYPHVLLIYKNPPVGDISLSEFEIFAFERLQVLRILEQTTQMGHKIYSEDWRTAVIGYLRKQNLRKYIRLIESTGCSSNDAESSIRREDYISHFILRLAYCRSSELRNWFKSRELELFKMRFLNLSHDGIRQFIKTNQLDYVPISCEEKEEIKSGLLQSTMGYSHVNIENSDFYKVPFAEVLDLVQAQMVYMLNGYAYIPTNELISCVLSELRQHLQEALTYASMRIPCLDDERITGLLGALHASYSGKDYSKQDENEASMTAETVHKVARKSFPLCMRNLYEVLHNVHHLKHFGRLQFGLYLKGIGLSLEEAIKFWKEEFCKAIDSETFDKKYLYNIKHSFGAIGRMFNYAPFGCKKIIASGAGNATEHHGCPFSLWDKDKLRDKLFEYGISQDGVLDVLELAAKGNYQIACSKYFIYTHGGKEPKQIINHPNQYFDESQDILAPSANKPENETYKRKYQEMSSQSTSKKSNTPIATTTDTMIEDVFDDDFDVAEINNLLD